ncbi:Cullin 3 [Schizosaccharomyces japonicus yFS275]|uniref:Cullin 3 n=1 Tax=Schizosaccharomyces japonicus (strain yFS275 / FY16936) TaxID=402676 RepID=B6K6K0_SCHJY|nr:Cullin 3 [Schizosaccharomyces japonicus yFS275]EEB09154.2 Cullin 3 [Schizosaccharomyces japonicus yFS275]
MNMQRPGKPKIRAPRKFYPKARDWKESWSVLSSAIQEIFQKNTSKLSFEELYRNAYTLVLYKNGDKLYNGVSELIASRLSTTIKETLNNDCDAKTIEQKNTATNSKQQLASCERYLSAVEKCWSEHTVAMYMIASVLKYMDKTYSKEAGELPIYDMGLLLFRDNVLFKEDNLGQLVIEAVLKLVEMDRNDMSINRPVVKSCLEMLILLPSKTKNLTLYDSFFTPLLLETSRTFYAEEATEFLECYTVPEYLKWLNERIEQENNRMRHYLSTRVETQVIGVLRDEFLSKRLTAILEMPSSGLWFMIENSQIAELTQLYNSFLTITEGIPQLRQFLYNRVIEKGREINANTERKSSSETGKPLSTTSIATQWVSSVLALWTKLTSILTESMNNDRLIHNTISDAFTSFINDCPRSPEYISLFIDDYLKKGLRGQSEAEVEQMLQKSVTLFRFVSEKDVFEKYYKIHLAKRLLNNRLSSEDVELELISRLKLEAGNVFTSKMEGMLTDMRLSQDANKEYKDYLTENNISSAFDLNVSVLASSFWPVEMQPEKLKCNFPQELEEAKDVFTSFYLSKHSGRQLAWYPTMGTADVRVAFKNRKHDLNVSTVALMILLHFEDVEATEPILYETLRDRIQIEESDLKRNLQSLACAKYKILLKEPKGRNINPGDKFYFNDAFTSNLARIKIATVASARVENDHERKETLEKIDESRKHQVEACIVRVMKDRKTLDHNQLIAEVSRQLSTRFMPNPMMIKRRIEALIEREYLQRNADNSRVYEYLA